ncbi:hypothetical protein OJ996_05640 [Luteolibacter sp. GHJ8]|uniref:Uncharacterized protein n=1 Tax=Luteolibacter rhizosphaerae TaxID=2989719 RepID=A0ABT3FZN1_9BACT|nr:hypothetical protein [Luteolibacter rhizosphaerae]
MKPVKVTDESDSGRNQRFLDPNRGAEMTRPQFVREIERGNYPDYHVREINGLKTPCSNPNASEGDNLG